MATEVVTVAVPGIPAYQRSRARFEARSTHGIIGLSDYTSKAEGFGCLPILRTSLPCALRHLWNRPITIPSLRSQRTTPGQLSGQCLCSHCVGAYIEEHFKLR